MKPMTERHLAVLRRHMVEMIEIHADLGSDETGRATLDPRVLAAMADVPRHHFVPAQLAALAYQDSPLPIGFDKTISQPYIVALMLDLLGCEDRDRVLEVGTGLGYQTAVLARLCGHVYSVEIVEEFAVHAERVLAALGVDNASIRHGDGTRGWAEHAPFDRIVIAAAAKAMPPALVEQLRPGGRIVAPIGPADDVQQLTVVDKRDDGRLDERAVLPVRFGALEVG
jgi:protein-L-isoaspartate(D-aspartate) O-methyltransferase